MILACLLLAACEPRLPKDYNGWWTGRSDTGNAITFQVHDGVVQNLRIGMGNLRCGSLTWSGTARVREQTLNIDVHENKQLEGAKSLKLSGRFHSNHDATGTLSAVAIGGVTNPGCSGMAVGKWIAYRDAWHSAQTKLNEEINDAIQWGDDARALKLISRTEDVNVSPSPPMDNAIARGNLTIVRALLRAGALPLGNTWANPPIRQAALAGHVEIVRELLQASEDQRAKDDALLAACKAGHLQIVRILLDARADVNVRSTTYESTSATTPLILATQGGHNAVVAYLLSRGADATVKDDDGHSAIDYAKDIRMRSVLGAR